jgi:nucleoside-diphosphate-sugar epimerase
MKKVLVTGGVGFIGPLDKGVLGVYYNSTNTTAFSVFRDGSFCCL